MPDTDPTTLLKRVLKDLEGNDATHGISRALSHLKREVEVFENHNKSVKENGTLRSFENVQIGGGAHVLEGFVNIDAFPPADIIWDVREGIPLTDSSAKFIFSEHFLEHIDYPVSVLKVFSEFKRITSAGGKLVIGVPDGGLAAHKYVSQDYGWFAELKERWYAKRDCVEALNTPIDLLNIHFRDEDASAKYTPHLWAYDFNKLESLLIKYGFTDVKLWSFDPSIANQKREWGSVYVEATRAHD